MSGGKHTPGPWFLEGHWDVKSKFDLGGWVSSNPPAGCPIFQLEPIVGTPEEIVANARLIAAAPETAAERDRLKEVNADLLAALKLFRTKVYNAALCSGMDHEWATEACSLADAAIAKAEGGAA
jgi:hypothetical protein